MPQESLSRREREERAGQELADALDAVSRPTAERILGRAIELDHEAAAAAEAAADSIDYDMLRDIASEVGISEESLKKALLEEIDTDKDHNAKPIEKATIPDDVRGGVVVQGAAEDVIRRLGDYLRRVEGLAEEWRQGQAARWTAGQRPVMNSWMTPQSGGNRHLVELDLETKPARKRAWKWIIGIVVLALLFGNFAGGLIFLAIWIAGMVAVVGWLRRLARKARRTINRALGSLVGEAEPPDDWLTVWEKSQR